ncbi:3-hydroxyacyl-CoA dehydrogenase [Neisseriaceae bacterium TC5R-5]|nr:3-hydroxyacyl-CoA dehydrogenase [Neisseriaceae bacterium TC5R-5]
MPALLSTQSVAVIGGGIMGRGIAMVAAQAGHPVQLYDVNTSAASQAVKHIQQQLERLVSKGKLTAQHAAQTAARISSAETLAQLADSSLIIEAIVERLDAKQALFCALETLVRPDCLFASNTSSLSITAIAAALQQPGRLAGMHFFNPAPVMALVEIVSGLASDPPTLARLHATARQWGKTPVMARSTPGFIVNRIARPFYLESLRLQQENVADCATLDWLLRESGGFRMGPFELMDLIGLDVNLAVNQSIWQALFYDARYTPLLLQQEQVNAGWLGRKSGRGYHRYDAEAPAFTPKTVTAQPCPDDIALNLSTAAGQALAQRLQQQGIAFTQQQAQQAWVARSAGAYLAVSDGRSADRYALEQGLSNVVLVDLALDYRQTGYLAVQTSSAITPSAQAAAYGLLQAAGIQLIHLPNCAGLPLIRTVAMLVNEACDALQQQLASAEDIDTAMCLGVNYPQGPLHWGEQIGYGFVRQVLRHLADSYGESRYRVSPWLEQWHYRHAAP